MAKTPSKKPNKSSRKKLSKPAFFARIKKSSPRPNKVKLHHSFCRSYREDYARNLEVPSISHHIFLTLKYIFQNRKIFLPLLLIAVILNIIFVGIMSESAYVEYQDILNQTGKNSAIEISGLAKSSLLLISTIATGGLSGEASESAIVFSILIFLILWLTTIFILRRSLTNKSVSLREALYNASTPLISTFLVFLVVIIQCIPIFALIIAYSAAIQTDFLSTPFYALVFFIFATVMVILSGYLLSGSLIALVAVSAPGLYPMKALHAASDLMAGRRLKFIIRLIALIFTLAILWAIIMLPLIALDLWLKTFEWTANIPFVPFCLNIMTCFTCIYLTTYLYLYYKWMLNYEEK